MDLVSPGPRSSDSVEQGREQGRRQAVACWPLTAAALAPAPHAMPCPAPAAGPLFTFSCIAPWAQQPPTCALHLFSPSQQARRMPLLASVSSALPRSAAGPGPPTAGQCSPPPARTCRRHGAAPPGSGAAARVRGAAPLLGDQQRRGGARHRPAAGCDGRDRGAHRNRQRAVRRAAAAVRGSNGGGADHPGDAGAGVLCPSAGGAGGAHCVAATRAHGCRRCNGRGLEVQPCCKGSPPA